MKFHNRNFKIIKLFPYVDINFSSGEIQKAMGAQAQVKKKQTSFVCKYSEIIGLKL